VINLDQQALVKARIVSVSDRDVMVDFGGKFEGLVARHEFGNDDPKVGDTIELFLERIEDSLGQAVLSRSKAEFIGVWNSVKQKYADAEIVEGTISRRTKGGWVVNILGVDAFLPGSQLDIRPIDNFNAQIGKTLDFKIVQVNEFCKNIVVSRKEFLEESLKEQRRKLLDEIEVDQILEGRVKRITNVGIFVDLGGIDGLLRTTDLPLEKLNHPLGVFHLEEDIIVKVVRYNPVKQHISLGLEQPKPQIEKRGTIPKLSANVEPYWLKCIVGSFRQKPWIIDFLESLDKNGGDLEKLCEHSGESIGDVWKFIRTDKDLLKSVSIIISRHSE